MKPSLRKLALTAHVTSSVGWLGAAAAYLALAVVALNSRDQQAVHAAHFAMGVVGWFVIIPSSLAALLSGVVGSLGTPWGLFRYWWVVAKLVLTAGATAVLLRHMQTVTRASRMAADTAASAADLRALQIQLVVHAGGGLVVLLAATVLSVYKPWGMTPYGLRARAGRPQSLPSARPARPEGSRRAGPGTVAVTPTWMLVAGAHAVGLVLLLLAVHLAGGGFRGH